jgi:hypothetical protein
MRIACYAADPGQATLLFRLESCQPAPLTSTVNFLASPEIVTAMAISGDLNFNPLTDTLPTPSGEPFRFSPPSGDRLPPTGYTPGDLSYAPSPSPTPVPETEIAIAPTSTRLEILEPFESSFVGGKGELPEMTCLMRVRGTCTTDHISAAGAWLKVSAGRRRDGATDVDPEEVGGDREIGWKSLGCINLTWRCSPPGGRGRGFGETPNCPLFLGWKLRAEERTLVWELGYHRRGERFCSCWQWNS